MLGALAANLLAVIRPARRGAGSVLQLGAPFNWIMLLLQAVFYGAALAGPRVGQAGRVGKLLYIPTFLLNSNLAAVIGLYRFVTRRHSNLWQRVNRRGEADVANHNPTATPALVPAEAAIGGKSEQL